MGWVGIEESGIEYTFRIVGEVEAWLSDSVAHTDSGDLPTAGTTGGWAIDFDAAPGREPFRLRITALEFASNWESGDNPCEVGLNDEWVQNEGEPDGWSPSPIEFDVSFDDGDATLTNWHGGNGNPGQNSQFLIEVWQDDPQTISYNCECDDDYPSTTLAEMRKRLLRRLGFAAQANNPPPGMADLLDDFIRQAQEILFRRYAVFRRERWFTWNLIPGVRFYDLDANADTCTKRLEPRMITWAGISQGDSSWRPLVCGIDPVMYTSGGPGIPSHYEIRQCIELLPAPSDATWLLRVKGQFGLLPLDDDSDKTSIDPEAIFLLALANAKAHYGQPDAGNYAQQLAAYVRDLIRGSHMTRRYFPGAADPRNAVRPMLEGGFPEDGA